MGDIDKNYCLGMARSLDAKAARTRGGSYLRKLLEDQANKYRADAAQRAATRAAASTAGLTTSERFADGCYVFQFDTGVA